MIDAVKFAHHVGKPDITKGLVCWLIPTVVQQDRWVAQGPCAMGSSWRAIEVKSEDNWTLSLEGKNQNTLSELSKHGPGCIHCLTGQRYIKFRDRADQLLRLRQESHALATEAQD